MPRIWADTLADHHDQVRDAILASVTDLVADHGLRGVTMSRLATETGIGRATLYKYFPDLDAVLHAWRDRQVDAHLLRLRAFRDRPGTGLDRLAAVLHAHAGIRFDAAQLGEAADVLHRDDDERLHELVTQLVEQAEVRTDVTADELATYCLAALGAAGRLPSRAAVNRLVDVTLTGLAPGDRTAARY